MKIFSFIIFFFIERSLCKDFQDVLVYTVATDYTDGFDRYLTSAQENGINPIVLGSGQKWKGGDDIARKPGGGWKVNLLLKALKDHENDIEKIVIFTDGYDVVFLNDLGEIVKRFKDSGARILFGAEPYCWPDETLKTKYPKVEVGDRFLNSGVYIGYLPEILDLLRREPISDTDDDQLFFTKAYLDKTFRLQNKFKLDHKSEIIQNLNGVKDIEVFVVKEKEGDIEHYIIKNNQFGTKPAILHGNGPSKLTLNYVSNYLFKSWNSDEGCVYCQKRLIDLASKNPSDWPIVFMALFVHYPTPFLEEMLEKIYDLDYPKDRLHLFIYNSEKYHVKNITNFVERVGTEYLSVKEITPDDSVAEHLARDLSLDQCVLKDCDFYFAVDSVTHLDNRLTLRLLIEQNRTVIAPMLTRPGKAWSNFWGALTKDGFYARSNDYMDIVYNRKRGLWNVPFITNCYLVNATLLKKYDRKVLNFNQPNMDADMAFCMNLRALDVFMYVNNRHDFGHLVNQETFDITLVEPEMYQIFDNEIDWERRYIRSDYPDNLNPEKKPLQPCPDVYWFPVTTKRFCNSLINMMESFGQWSSGTNNDNRLESGYEAVPTRDIHMNQVGFDKHWLQFLDKYVRPLQEHVFLGYIHDPPRSLMNFVVRYRPDEQPSLRPHHDSSTYTINLALNRRNIDYEGGGCKFIRYNCSVVDTKQGWLLMHPGRLTHYHEGLLVTKGTRYIMISFVDP